MSKRPQPRPVSELGEFGLIRHLTENIKLNSGNVLKGIGDDAAVVRHSKAFRIVTTDLLCEGIHFDLLYTPAKHLGYKSVIASLSDVCAMNAEPKEITVSLALSNRISVDFLEELYAGIALACEKYGVDLIGGDTSSSKSGLVISVTAIGEAEEGEVVYRSGAKENDLICVSGDLGAAYMGLQLLEREKAVFESDERVQPDLSGNDYVLERQLKPEARMDVIRSLKSAGILPTAMIDISDGLSSDLLHICRESGMGCNLFEDRIPVDASTSMLAESFKMSALTAALNGGEDYELLFTADIKEHVKIKDLAGISIIGHMTGRGESAFLVTDAGQAVELKAQGFQAFGGKT